jgi:hypothetical protein
MTAAGEIVVGDVGIPMPAFADAFVESVSAFERFTIFGAPRTTVRPSPSSSSIAANLPDRVEAAGDDDVRDGGDDDVRDGGDDDVRDGGGAPAAGRTEGTASPSAFVGRMFVISSSLTDEYFGRTEPVLAAIAGGGTLRFETGGGGRLDDLTPTPMSSLVTTSSLSPDSSRPGRFVKGSMILRSLDPHSLANRKPAQGHSTQNIQ